MSQLFSTQHTSHDTTGPTLPKEEVKSKEDDAASQMVGRCFLRHAEAMKRAYTDYCVNNDRAEQLLEKYEAGEAEVQRLLQKGVETLQAQVPLTGPKFYQFQDIMEELVEIWQDLLIIFLSPSLAVLDPTNFAYEYENKV